VCSETCGVTNGYIIGYTGFLVNTGRARGPRLCPLRTHLVEGMEPSQSSGVKGETKSPLAFKGWKF